MRVHASHSLTLCTCAFAASVAACGAADPQVTVTDDGVPVAGAEVVFHDGRGTPVAHVTTGADGQASADIDDGGMITVLVEHPQFGRVRGTFMGVERGDALTFAPPWWHAERIGTARIVVTPYPGAATYVVQTPRATVYTADVGEPIELEITDRALSPDGTLQVLVTAGDANGDLMAVASVRDAAWTQPMTVTMPAWRAPATYMLQTTAAPAGARSVWAELAYQANGVRLFGASRTQAMSPGEAALFVMSYAPDFADWLDAQVAVLFGGDDEEPAAATLLVERRAVPPSGRMLSLITGMLPAIGGLTVDDAAARPTMTWPAADLSAADGGAASFVWTDASMNRAGWTVLVPPDVTHVQLPALPAELAAWTPPAGATFADSALVFVDGDWMSSYDALRSDVAAMAFAAGDVRAILPARDARLTATMTGDL